MGTITVNVKDDVEERFRETVKEEFGVGKGKLGRAFAEAMLAWLKEKEQKEIAERAIKRMDKGLYRLGKWKFNRDEIYEERLNKQMGKRK